MDASLLDVFHDGTDDDRLAVADAVHVHLGRVFEEMIHEDRVRRLAGRAVNRVAHVFAQVGFVVDEHHAASAEHKARAHEHGIRHAVRHGHGFVLGHGGAAAGLADAEPVEHRAEKFAVLGDLDAARRRADDGNAGFGEAVGEVQRRLPAELHDDAEEILALLLADVQHVLERERLEVELVARVVVGRDGLGVRVHHDGLEAHLAQRERRVDAAVVKLDALPDAVRPAAEDDDFLLPALAPLVFVAVGRVVIRRVGLELRRAGVHEAVGGH